MSNFVELVFFLGPPLGLIGVITILISLVTDVRDTQRLLLTAGVGLALLSILMSSWKAEMTTRRTNEAVEILKYTCN